jgi:uncharacterized membrane protein
MSPESKLLLATEHDRKHLIHTLSPIIETVSFYFKETYMQ